jgi:hypothetical protein
MFYQSSTCAFCGKGNIPRQLQLEVENCKHHFTAESRRKDDELEHLRVDLKRLKSLELGGTKAVVAVCAMSRLLHVSTLFTTHTQAAPVDLLEANTLKATVAQLKGELSGLKVQHGADKLRIEELEGEVKRLNDML